MSGMFHFESFRFEPGTGRLWQDEQEVKLTPKAADVLAQLLERPGDPVTKRELFASVWRDTIVGDDALITCVQELRRVLGDDARQPRFIETRHRRGYRFIAKVEATEIESAGRAGTAVATDPPLDPSAIAVLPFIDMSPAHDQDFFCEGLAEELIDALTHVDGLRVVSRSSAFQFKGAGVDMREAGRRLGVGLLLEGSVRKSGDRLRITAQLIDATNGYHKWSQRFERELGDVFAIQDEIAETVATLLRGGALSSRERSGLRRQHTASETYECYLRGRQQLARMRRPHLEESRRLFERAIELDASYAPAWAGLANVHATLYEWFGSDPDDRDRADRASAAAMALAPNLADAHVARGFALSQHGRYDEAQTHFESALRINPNLFEAWYYYGRMSFARGDIEASVRLFRRAADVRQEDFQSPFLAGQSLNMLGRREEARAAGHEGVVRAERVLALNPLDGRALSLGSGALHMDGQFERAWEWANRAVELYPDDMSALISAACLRCKMGMKEEALEYLERIFSRGYGKRDWIEHDPDYDILRDDPRFQRLVERLK
jgi:adenylate cyclase